MDGVRDPLDVARRRALPLVAAAALLLVVGAGLQACAQTDPAVPGAATTAQPTTATPIAATAAPAPTATATPATSTPAAATPAPPPAAAATPTPVPTATPATGGSSGLQVLPKDTAAAKPPPSSGGARENPGIEVKPIDPDEEPSKPPARPDGAGGASSGRVYTWQDGEITRRVVLQSDLTVRATNEVSSQDEVVAVGGASAVVQGSGEQPVFRSESGGELMALPGGVLLVLDANWSDERVAGFLARNAIAGSHVSDLGWLPNGYFIETAPGFPSLDLANALAGQDGVVLAAPNWWREVETR